VQQANKTAAQPTPAANGTAPLETIAVIDLGTNTFHLLIVELGEHDNWTIRDKYKEVVKLGEGGINEGIISAEAFNRGISALVRFRKVIDSRRVTKVLACGTSALRSAQNAKEFLIKAKEMAGIDINVINGNEEALYIYKGVRGGVQFPFDEDVLIMDIGGGSVEFIVGDQTQPKLLRSLRLGAARLLESVRPGDPISKKEIEQVRKAIEHQADSLMDEIRDFKVKRIIGSSGSFETMGAMIAYDNGDLLSMENVNGYRYDKKKFKKIHQRLLDNARAERLAMGGMEPARVDMMVMATLLMEYVMDKLKLEHVTVSAYALKEGILYDYLENTRDRHHTPSERTMREKAVRTYAARFEYDERHCDQVARLGLQMFDQLQSYHGFGEEERELLHYAALLHDVGHYVNRSGHHKHGQYIVMNSGMQGFSTNELLVLGNIVRYHRRSLPSREHFHFNMLYKEHKEVVRKLAGILRIADNLDRGHRNQVRELKVKMDPSGKMLIQVLANDSIEVELQSARAETELLQDSFGLYAAQIVLG
jgi:exopolyphosphatase/guanosine-5'-triphosphate,3'-diphosphate pyrophosphatase